MKKHLHILIFEVVVFLCAQMEEPPSLFPPLPEPEKKKFKLAVLVPFRSPLSQRSCKRFEQLCVFLEFITEILEAHRKSSQSYLEEYQIFVAEQACDGRPFNRGCILNAAAKTAIAAGYDSLCFHDVDLVPGDAKSLTTRADDPDYIKETDACVTETIELYSAAPRPHPIHIGWAWDRYKYGHYSGGVLTVDALDF